MKRILVSVTLLLLCALGVSAQTSEDPQTAEFNYGYSDSVPGLASGSHARFPGQLPSALIANPASYNVLGVPLLELGYTGIIDLGANGYSGHRASGWVNYPLNNGQLLGGLEFQSLSTSLASTGTAARLHAGWSNTFREIYIIGAGIETGLSQGPEGMDWALNGKLGISQNLGPLWIFDQFSWNASLTGLGKEMFTRGGTYYRSPFTPRAGANGRTSLSSWLEWHNALELAVPRFTDFMINLQSSFVAFDNFVLSLAWGLDFTQLLSSEYQNASLFPRASFSYSLLGKSHPDLDINLAVYSPYRNHLAVGVGSAFVMERVDREGPEIALEMPETVYISPNNDGRQDAWDQDLQVTDPSGISLLEMQLRSRESLVFTQSWEIEEIRSEGLYGIVQEAFAGVQTAVIPSSVLIGGRSTDGSPLEDGEYELVLIARDILGNETQISPAKVIIDTRAPEINLAQLDVEEKIFSPNNDGNKDILPIPQSGSIEHEWFMEIQDSSETMVWSRSLTDAAPSDLNWDGHDNQGQRLPDGVYRYSIRSRDRAGNSNEAELSNIIINSVVSPVRIEVAATHFSPNGDGVRDQIGFQPQYEARTGISGWTIDILDDREARVSGIGENGAPAATILFDGMDESGAVLPEGRYRARFTLNYFSGNAPRALSPWFTIDTSAPAISLELESDLFSPNNDNRADELLIYQEGSEEEQWSAQIFDLENGLPIRSYSFRGAPPFELRWDGRTDEGDLAPDGEYFYRIAATDRAGNRNERSSQSFRLDTADAEVLVNASLDAFSPNADQRRDFQDFSIRVSNNDQVRSFEFSILNQEGSPVRLIRGDSSVPETIRWDGRNDEGVLVSDGQYSGRLQVELENRSIGEGNSRRFTLDTQAPRINVSSEYQIFSPNGDERRDNLPIRQSSSTEELFTGRILREDGTLVREYLWEDRLESFAWDGLDSLGNLAPNGVYRYEVVSEDSAGNLSRGSVESIELDSRNISVFLTLSETGISPNADGYKDSMEIGLFTNVTDGIESWELLIQTDNEQLVRRYSGSSLEAQNRIQFDGRDNDGDLAEGRMNALFRVVYEKGDTPEARSSAFRVDQTGPALSARVSPTPFGPDGDGIADVLNIDLAANDPAGIAGYRFSIFDRVGNLFHEFSGQGAPEERIFWDGLSASGERVISAEDYRYEFEAIDRLGNSSMEAGLIPIDILVIRDGDNYKVQISNIVFEPNSPRIVLGGVSDVGIRNQAILTRLVQVFEKYPQYRIVIEGHANNVSGTEREEVEELLPLSEGRALAVKEQMVALGLDPERISTVGRGGRMPLVPFDDEENRWKNRRVEFILIR